MPGHLLWRQPHCTCYALHQHCFRKTPPIKWCNEGASRAWERCRCVEPLLRTNTGSIIGAQFSAAPLWNYPRGCCLHRDMRRVCIHLKGNLIKMPGNAYSLDKCARIKIREKDLKSKLQKWGITLCIERSFACSASARSKKKLPQVEKPELLSAEARKIFFYDKNAGVLPHAKTQSVLKQLIGW